MRGGWGGGGVWRWGVWRWDRLDSLPLGFSGCCIWFEGRDASTPKELASRAPSPLSMTMFIHHIGNWAD